MLEQHAAPERMIALVTGASGGIGFEIARKLLEKDVSVGVHYCRNREAAERLVAMAQDGRCKIFQADFSSSRQVMQLWSEFIDWGGTIGILVNNAGGVPEGMPLDSLTEDAWDQTFQVNVKAPFLLSQAAMAVMRERNWGRIINVSSIGVKFGGGSTTAHYSASKAALEAITRSFAKEGASHNVLVNAVRAGVTDTPFHEKIGRDNLSDRAKLIPLKRLAHPREIADVVLFLASEAASYITGSIVPVSGGE